MRIGSVDSELESLEWEQNRLLGRRMVGVTFGV